MTGNERSVRWERAKALSGWVVAVILAISLFSVVTVALNPSFGTVVQPGSMVSPSNYVVFRDGSTYFGRNGLTGALSYIGTNATWVLTSIVGQLPTGGIITLREGYYNLPSPWYIDTPGIIVNGIAADFPNNVPPASTKGTEIIGNVVVRNRDVQLNDLSILGNLTITTTPSPYNNVADFFSANHLQVDGGTGQFGGGVQITGYAGADASHIPYNIAFTNSYIAGRNVPAFAMSYVGWHIYVTNSILVQYGGGDVIRMIGGGADVVFTNTLLDTSELGGTRSTILNLTGAGGDTWNVRFINVNVEPNGASNQVLVDIGSGYSTNLVSISWVDSWLTHASLFAYLVRDAMTAHRDWHTVVFSRLQTDYATLTFKGGDATPQVTIRFLDCLFYQTMTVVQTYGAYVGEFSRCAGINPVGPIATPFSGVNDDWKYISIASSFTGSATPPASKNITVMDTAILLTSSGGTGISITIRDPDGAVVLSGSSTLTNYYIPIGFRINFGAFSVAPTVTVVGV